jgi:flagellar biosynthesis GTPase FlhF
MLIKNFQAGSIQDALDLVRKEFGKEAVILKTDVLGTNGSRQFSVTAARDYEAKPVKGRKTTAQPTRVTTISAPVPQSARLESALLDIVIPDLLNGEIKRIFLSLRCHDVEAQSALDICRQLQRQEQPNRANLAKILSVISPASIELPEESSSIVFIGPCGSGKSSMLAKFATEFVFHRKQKVTLQTLDNFRPGAEEEICNLTEILDLVVDTPGQKTKPRPISHHLIDTTGVVLGDLSARDTLENELASIGDRFTVLVMALTTGWTHIRKYIEFARPLGIDAIALTQLDATDSCGSVLNLAVGEYPPLLCLSDSRLPNAVIYNFDANACLDKLVGAEDAE